MAQPTTFPFGLGVSISPSWSSDDELDRLAEVAQLGSRAGASVFLLGDKPTRDPGARSNAVLLGWLARDLVRVPRVGSLFLVRELPVHSLLVTARTTGELIRRGGSTPVVGIMRGRDDAETPMPGPDVEVAAEALRADPALSDMELWVGAERGQALDRAGRVADVWLANAHYDNEALTDQLRRFRRQSSQQAGAAVRRDFVCNADSATAHAEARRLLADGYRGGKFDDSVLIAGSPAECLERLAEVAVLGFDDVLVRPAVSGQAAVEQFDRLFEEWARR
jgi:alkanesulfonate monooxygenase SsuD/methylene tetrahydromethanopterin reductase-like flavin-dependent oxidoreductase (luciferase family)